MSAMRNARSVPKWVQSTADADAELEAWKKAETERILAGAAKLEVELREVVDAAEWCQQIVFDEAIAPEAHAKVLTSGEDQERGVVLRVWSDGTVEVHWLRPKPASCEVFLRPIPEPEADGIVRRVLPRLTSDARRRLVRAMGEGPSRNAPQDKDGQNDHKY